MIRVRIWNLEPDREANTVEFLENKFVRLRQSKDLVVWKTGRDALRKCREEREFSSAKLSKAIQYYLNQDDYIIFVANSDNSGLDYQTQLEPEPLVNQIKRVVKVWNLSDKVIFTPMVQEPQSVAKTRWESIFSEFCAEVESDREQFQKRWYKAMERFRNAFADALDDKLTSDLDTAIKRYQGGGVTLGRAAELAGLHRFEFEEALKARNIPKVVDVDSAETLKEGVSFIRSLQNLNVNTEE